MSSPLFSIVIPTYNRAELLKRCLNSVIAQTVQDWEAIVVDNYSEDNTEEVVNSFHDSRIRYLKNHNHGVIAVSRNKALDLAKGQYVCFLDSDDYWVPCKLEILLPLMNKYDLVYHDYFTNVEKRYLFHRTSSKFYDIKKVSVAYVIQRGDPINPSCTCVSMAVIGDTRFDESKSLFAVEDYDFFLQLMNKKMRIKKLNKELTYYDVSTGCSHGIKSLERDMQLFQKYSTVLSEKEKNNFLKLHDYKEGGYYMSLGDYDNAIIYLKKAFSSSIFQVKKKSLTAILHCYFNKCFLSKKL